MLYTTLKQKIVGTYGWWWSWSPTKLLVLASLANGNHSASHWCWKKIRGVFRTAWWTMAAAKNMTVKKNAAWGKYANSMGKSNLVRVYVFTQSICRLSLANFARWSRDLRGVFSLDEAESWWVCEEATQKQIAVYYRAVIFFWNSSRCQFKRAWY